tara:strand:+ start:1132 stop:1422 length:291 start_codon:yes stop_codon:yes gene_type:complete
VFQINSRKVNSNQKRTSLEHILWFIENYLPQKKNRSSRKEFRLDNLESETIKYVKKFASLRSKSLTKDLANTKVTFTIGSWALPYLRILKRTGLLK